MTIAELITHLQRYQHPEKALVETGPRDSQSLEPTIEWTDGETRHGLWIWDTDAEREGDTGEAVSNHAEQSQPAAA